MKTIAIIGPDGAGKTTLARDMLQKFEVSRTFHAIPFTSKLPKVDNKWYRYTHEVLMGFEKVVRNQYLRHVAQDSNDGTWLLDRCAIDAEAYAALWCIHTKSMTPLKIALAFNQFAYWPTFVIFLRADPFRAKPKRNYRAIDIALLNEFYAKALEINGYVLFDERHQGIVYAMGTRIDFLKKYARLSLNRKFALYQQIVRKTIWGE